MLMKQFDNQKQKSTWRICVIFAPQSTVASTTTVESTLHLLEPLAKEIFAITGNFPEDAISGRKIHIINIKHSYSHDLPMLIRIPKFMSLQLKISYILIKIAKKVDIVLLAAGTSPFFLPALLAKLLRKWIILLHHGTNSFDKIVKADYQKTLVGMGRYIFPPIAHTLVRLNCSLADRIAVLSSDITDPRLKRFANKISFSGSRFYVDVSSFKVERNLDSRENLVGYIGRFEEIKGVMNFVKAIPMVLRESAGVKFMAGGDGSLRDETEREIKDANLGDKVTMTGWIPYHKLPQYLNEIKLLVIPSYAEAGPHMLFEAMACGTPVLATPVGVMPDVIKDGKTGFIMEDNSPECIAKNVIRALNHSNLAQIAKAARNLVEKEYTHEAAVERYRSILASLR